jgi:hypothetical protein
VHRRSLRALASLLVVAVCGSVASVGGAVPARAAATLALPLSLGTATASYDGQSWNFTLSGSIAVGAGVFTGSASGAAPADYGFIAPLPRTPIPPFTLTGPGLTGTCSGQWLTDPSDFDPTGGYLVGLPPPPPVNVASLSCTLQLGLAPPAQTSLTLALIADNPPANTHLTGVYGPGLSSVPIPVPRSRGLADRAGADDREGYHLLGDIELGGQVFHGDAFGGYKLSDPPDAPFPLTGSSASGALAATCTASALDPISIGLVNRVLMSLSCTGSVGSGPVGTTTLIVVLPIQKYHFGTCACGAWDHTGVFLAP